MLDSTHGRMEMDLLRKELDDCWMAPGHFDTLRAANIYAKMTMLLAEGATGTYHHSVMGRPKRSQSCE